MVKHVSLIHRETPFSWIVEGRNRRNEHYVKSFHQAPDVSSWLESHQAVQNMIVQPYLEA